MTRTPWTYQKRLNQIERLDAADLAVIDATHENFRQNVENPVDAEDWLAVERVLVGMRQEIQNLNADIDKLTGRRV